MASATELRGAEAQAYLSRQIAELRAVYAEAARQMELTLARATATDFAKFRAAEYLRQVRALVAALDVRARGIAEKSVPIAYERGTDIGAESLAGQGVAAELNLGNKIHTQGVAVLTDQMTLDLLQANQTLKTQAERHIRRTQLAGQQDQQISRLIAQGVAQGETRRQTSNRIRDELVASLPQGGKVVVNGRQFDPAYYAELVARTRTREAVTQGAINSAVEYGVDLFQVSFHASSCPVCVPFQGKVFSLSGGTPGFPRLEKKPPFHPQCLVDVDTPIETRTGKVPYSSVRVGDEVYTHTGHYRRVVAKMSRRYVGRTVRVGSLELTPNHGVMTEAGWVEAGLLTPTTKIMKLDDIDGAFFHYPLPLVPGWHDGEVYNLTVEVDHAYVAAGIVVKNCGHVLLPYIPVPGKDAELEALKRISNGNVEILTDADYRAALKGKSVTDGLKGRPAGAAVGTFVQPIKSPALQAPVGRAMGAIDSVHGVENLPKVSVTTGPTRGAAGSYRPSWDKPVIRVDETLPTAEFTVLHEMGHLLDHRAIRAGHRGEWSSPKTLLLKEWREAVKGTDTVKRLQGMLAGPKGTTLTVNGVAVNKFVDKSHLRYLLEDRELFARSYAQYIARKSGDPVLRRQLRAHQAPPPPTQVWYTRQWPDDEFAPIERAFDLLFARLGWRV